MESTLKDYIQSLKDENAQLQEQLKEASRTLVQLADLVTDAMTPPSLVLRFVIDA